MRGLVSAEVQADGEVEFSCEVSQAGATDVEWRLQGLPLQNNEVTEVAMRDGRTHTLRLKGVTLEDAGTVSFHVGVHMSSAQLTVRGSKCGQLLCLPTWGWNIQALLGDRDRLQRSLLLKWGTGREVALYMGSSGWPEMSGLSDAPCACLQGLGWGAWDGLQDWEALLMVGHPRSLG